MYLITAMEINILLEVLNPNNHAQLLDTLPSYQTHPAQFLPLPGSAQCNGINVIIMS